MAIRELEMRGVNFKPAAFLAAVEAGDKALVDLFVRVGINIHIYDTKNEPVLIGALKRGYTVIANILLTAGAEPNVRDALGFTPLLLACGKTTAGYKSIAMELIKRGADVNTRDPLGWTPLLLAISSGNADILKALLEHGANPAARTRKGENAMALAKKYGKEALIDLLFTTSSSNPFGF